MLDSLIGQHTNTAKLVTDGNRVAIELTVEIGTRDEAMQNLLLSKMLRACSIIEPDLMCEPAEEIERQVEEMKANQSVQSITVTQS